MDNTHCFVITRHVNSEHQNNYWNECYTCIRKVYPTVAVFIIDDDSNYEFIKILPSTPPINNVFFIQSEFPKRGELLPYYYMNKFKIYKTAIIIHDNVFIQNPIPDSILTNQSPHPLFLWNFQHELDHDVPIIKHLITKLNPEHSERLLQLYDQKDKWCGCYGVMSIINTEYISSVLDKTYHFFNLLQEVDTRMHRCCLERVFGLICSDSNQSPNHVLLGDFFEFTNQYASRLYVPYYFEQYMIDKLDNNKNIQRFPMIKTHASR